MSTYFLSIDWLFEMNQSQLKTAMLFYPLAYFKWKSSLDEALLNQTFIKLLPLLYLGNQLMSIMRFKINSSFNASVASCLDKIGSCSKNGYRFQKNCYTSRHIFGALLSIIAIAGNEWIKVESGIIKVTSGFWLNCLKIKGQSNDCRTINVSEIEDSKLRG